MEPMKLNAGERNVPNCLWEAHPRNMMQQAADLMAELRAILDRIDGGDST